MSLDVADIHTDKCRDDPFAIHKNHDMWVFDKKIHLGWNEWVYTHICRTNPLWSISYRTNNAVGMADDQRVHLSELSIVWPQISSTYTRQYPDTWASTIEALSFLSVRFRDFCQHIAPTLISDCSTSFNKLDPNGEAYKQIKPYLETTLTKDTYDTLSPL